MGSFAQPSFYSGISVIKSHSHWKNVNFPRLMSGLQIANVNFMTADNSLTSIPTKLNIIYTIQGEKMGK